MRPAQCFYPHRAARRYRDHRDPGGDAVAGAEQSQGQGATDPVHEQLPADWDGRHGVSE